MNGEKEKKELLRKRIKSLLNDSSISLLEEKSSIIQSHLYSLPEYKNSSVVMFYVSTDKEVSTRAPIEKAISENKQIAIPFILKSKNIMLPCKITDFKDLNPGPLGILQPSKEKIQTVSLPSIDLIIVPGIAFDKKGNRVGRGKGFYDRFLKLANPKTPKIALAFSCQIAEQIPSKEYDIAMDKIITEDGVIACK